MISKTKIMLVDHVLKTCLIIEQDSRLKLTLCSVKVLINSEIHCKHGKSFKKKRGINRYQLHIQTY